MDDSDCDPKVASERRALFTRLPEWPSPEHTVEGASGSSARVTRSLALAGLRATDTRAPLARAEARGSARASPAAGFLLFLDDAIVGVHGALEVRARLDLAADRALEEGLQTLAALD